MSTEPERIDLDSVAGLVDRENDVNVAEQMVKENLMESVNGQSQVQGQVVGEFRVLGGVNHRVVNGLGEEREMMGVDKGSDFEKDIGSMGKEVDDEVGGLSLDGIMADENRLGIDGNGERVSMKEERKKAAEIQASGVVVDGININVCPEDNVNDHVNEDKSPGLWDSDDMVIDSLDEANRSRTMGSDGSGEAAVLNIGNCSSPIDLVVDLNQCMSTDGDGSHDINAQFDASKSVFCVSDLVWGKVTSHPWWPGQIFESSAASAKAKKYFRTDTHLIAYFGDRTFAWNDTSRIKPFRAHFSEMERQSSLEDFRYAIHCALEEIARRTEFGLACSCICEEVYAEIKTQVIANAGIRKKASRRDGGDNFSNATSFKPLQLVEFVKGLAQSPQYDRIGALRFVTSKSQLSAFHHWKGYSELPQFQVLGGSLESAAVISISEEVKQSEEVNEKTVHCVEVDGQVPSADCKPLSQNITSHKRKRTPKGGVSSSKKEKSLSDLITDACLNKRSGKKGLDGIPDSKPSASARGAKRKSNDSGSDDSAVKHGKRNTIESADKSLQSKQSFRVGASILRVAGHLNGSTPVLKHDKISRKPAVKNKSSSTGKSQCKEISQTDKACPCEMLSKLLLAATDPMESYNCLTSVVSFFTELRNFVSLDGKSSETHGQATEQGSKDEMVENTTKLEVARTPDKGQTEDSYWDRKIGKCLPEESLAANEQHLAAGCLSKTIVENGNSNVSGQSDFQSIPNMGMGHNNPVVNLAMEAEKPLALLQVDENGGEDPSPTALILNFSNLESVPMEENLNEIFSRYGPLNESETEVLKKSNRAKVVFKRRADAEAAFSSAGKYRIFGPSLISYRLKYLPCKPRKASQNTKRKNQEKRKS